MNNEKALNAEEKSIADSIQSSVEHVRAPLGDLVTSFGQQGEHPMGVALALAGAAATVIASLMAASGQSQHIAKLTMESLFEEAQKAGLDAMTMMVSAKNLGLTPEKIAAQVKLAAEQKEAA